MGEHPLLPFDTRFCGQGFRCARVMYEGEDGPETGEIKGFMEKTTAHRNEQFRSFQALEDCERDDT